MKVDLQPVRVHIGEVKASRKAHPSRYHNNIRGRNNVPPTNYLLFAHPVLFSKRVKASLVETFLSPEHTSNAMIAATVVPTASKLGSGVRKVQNLVLAVHNNIK